jgi:peptidyl-prolyl cis-trans isomerase D
MGDKVANDRFAVKVNDVIVSDNEFRQKLDTTRENFRSLFGDNVDQLLGENSIERTVMETLIDETLLRSEAARLKLPVSDVEVAGYIQGMQAFQTDGTFDQERYREILARNRLTPQIFENSVRSDITLNKMEELIRKSVAVSDAEMNNEYVYQNTTASVRYLELQADSFKKEIDANEEALKEFFDENKENYRVPEKADFKYVAFDVNNYENKEGVTDQEVENYFIRNKDSFKEKEKVKASHILFKVDNWDDELAANEVYKKAKDVLGQIKDGADFAEMAKKHSADGNASIGGDLGYFNKGQMVKPFEDAAFSLKSGEISDVVKTQFGFHIIKVEEYSPEKNPTLDEVREKVKAEIAEKKAATSFRSYVYDKYKDIVSASNITAYNEQAEDKLVISEVKGLSAMGDKDPVKGMADIAGKLMKLNKSEISQVLDVLGRKIVFEMTEKYDSYIPEFADVKPMVENDFLLARSLKKAQDTAAEAAKLETMDAAAEKLQKNYSTTPKFKRNEPITGLGMNQALMTAIFESTPGDFIQNAYTIGRKVFLVQVKDIVKPNPEEMTDIQKEQIYSALIGVKSAQAVQAYVDNLK